MKPAPRPPRESSKVALRLAIGRDGLGIELARPAPLGPLDVVELTVRLPQVRFPFDVSGGVTKFRHRRGELDRLAVEVDERKLGRWLETKLRGLLDPGPCTVTVSLRGFGATVGIVTAATGLRALAFEVALLPSRDSAVAVVHTARGVGLTHPATALAIRAFTSIVGDETKREGSRFVLARPAERIARRLLPDAGARAPEGADVRLSGSGESGGVLFAIFTRGGAIAQVPDEATLANEAAELARLADDARTSGDLERARDLDVAALERAPRHPEIARRIAEIDAHVGGRAEAALSTLRESGAVRVGALGAAFQVETGDVDGAIATLLREAERETSPVVAALLFTEIGRLTRSPEEALRALDAAVARAPRLAELRWMRSVQRLGVGRLADARADFQELEALAQGARERHAVLRRAGDVYRDAGLGAEAAALFERALLYRPDDAEALAGLGAAIAVEGRAARGAALLQHAIEIAKRRQENVAWMELELAKVLADRLDDKPDAVARLRAIPDEAPEAVVARGLEGRYRALIGDLPGAALAFARLRERAGRATEAVPFLIEAAAFEEARGELAAAQRHLAVANAIVPADGDVAGRLRALGERIAHEAGMRPAPPAAPAPAAPAPAAPALPPAPAAPPAPALPLDEAEAEQRVEALTRTLQADPTNDAVIDELASLLTRLGRTMDLLALLSARLEDAPPERRDELLPKHREVLSLLEREAREAGRDGEADLFRMAREAS